VDIDSPIILEGHLQCAALERPINLSTDLLYFGSEAKGICKEHLVSDPSDGVSICESLRLCTILCIYESIYRVSSTAAIRDFSQTRLDL